MTESHLQFIWQWWTDGVSTLASLFHHLRDLECMIRFKIKSGTRCYFSRFEVHTWTHAMQEASGRKLTGRCHLAKSSSSPHQHYEVFPMSGPLYILDNNSLVRERGILTLLKIGLLFELPPKEEHLQWGSYLYHCY